MKKTILIFFVLICGVINAQDASYLIEPIEYTYKIAGADSLKAYVFTPLDISKNENRPAIAIFHGGGWVVGEPAWCFDLAKKYAKSGLISIAVQYRLSDQKNITPIDAMEDAKDFFIWARENCKEQKLHRDKVAALGWSAGGHLVTSAAVFPKYNADATLNSSPNALLLQSPGVSILNDGWFKRLLLNRGKPIDYSPAQHIEKNMPPTIIVIGRDDTVTPLKYAELFRDEMIKHGNRCDLHVYHGVGHLFTPSYLSDKGQPHPDKTVSKKAFHEIDLFLKELGYIK